MIKHLLSKQVVNPHKPGMKPAIYRQGNKVGINKHKKGNGIYLYIEMKCLHHLDLWTNKKIKQK